MLMGTGSWAQHPADPETQTEQRGAGRVAWEPSVQFSHKPKNASEIKVLKNKEKKVLQQSG